MADQYSLLAPMVVTPIIVKPAAVTRIVTEMPTRPERNEAGKAGTNPANGRERR